MVRKYVKKTNRRRQEDRHLVIRAEHRDPPDLDKLCQLLIRITLQGIGEAHAQAASQEQPSIPGSTRLHIERGGAESRSSGEKQLDPSSPRAPQT